MRKSTRHIKQVPKGFLRGISLIEVLYSVALLAIVTSSILVSLTGQLFNLTDANDSLIALGVAEEGVEATRMIRDTDWDAFSLGTHGLEYASDTWSFTGTEDVTSKFTRSVTVTELATHERQVDVDVSWMQTPLRPKTVTLTTILSDWRNVFELDTEGILTGDWRNPVTLATIDLSPGVEGTALKVKNKIVYIVGEASSEAKEDFFVIDATDGAHPVLRDAINTAQGLMDVYVSGTYAYVAAIPKVSNTIHFQIIDISNPDNATLVGETTLVGNNQYYALSVGMSKTGEYAFIGMQQNPGHEFFTVRVSNPYNPSIIGSYPVEGDVNDMVVIGDYVYLATGQDDAELLILDVTYPWNAQYYKHLDLSGSNDALSIYINQMDNRGYIGRAMQTGVGYVELNILDVEDPHTPIQLGENDFGWSVNSIFAGDELLFLATDYSNEELKIYDVTDPANIIYYSGLNFSQIASDIDFEDNTVYVSVRSNDAHRIITSQH